MQAPKTNLYKKYKLSYILYIVYLFPRVPQDDNDISRGYLRIERLNNEPYKGNDMKPFLLLGLLFFSTSLTWAGGIDGGGGGTLPANAITIGHVFNTIRYDAKINLRMYFRGLEQSSDFKPQPYDQKLFGGPTTLLNVLENTEIEIPTSGPCYDAFGKAVDGSVHASKPNTICISAFSIAPKLIQERAVPEILALIAHELSHLLGTTEVEADLIQQKAVNDLRFADWQKARNFVGGEYWKSSQISTIAKQDITNKSANEIVLILERLNDYFDVYAWDHPLAVFTQKDQDYLAFQKAKLNLMQWYALSISTDPTSTEWKNKYDSLFSQGGQVRLSDVPGFGGAQNQYSHLTLNRIQNFQEIQQQLNEIQDHSHYVSTYLWNMLETNPLPALPDPDVTFKNPWIPLVGLYDVIGTSCSKVGDPHNFNGMTNVKSFTIQTIDSMNPNKLRLIGTEATGGWGQNYGLYPESNETYIPWAVIQVLTRGNQTVLVNQFGNSWNRMSREEFAIEKIGNEYQIQRTYVDFENYDPSVPTFNSSATCTYKLERMITIEAPISKKK